MFSFLLIFGVIYKVYGGKSNITFRYNVAGAKIAL